MDKLIAALKVRIGADIKPLLAGLGTAKTRLGGWKKAITANLKSLTGAFAKFGVAVAAAIAIIAVKSWMDFDDAMTKSLAIMGDITPKMRKQMEDVARNVAKTTLFSASQAADAYYFLASAGLDAAQSMEALPKVAAFAQAGNFDLALATDLLTDAQSALGLTVDDTAENMENMARVSDVLVKANTLANASVEQFAESLAGKGGAALKAVNKDIEEGAAILSVFADQGLKGSAAGQALEIVLRDLDAALAKEPEAWKRLGLEVYDSAGKMRNIADITGDLEGALAGMSDEQRIATLRLLGFQQRSVKNIKMLLGNSDALREYEGALRDAGGITDEVANKQLKSFRAQLKLLWSQVQDLLLTIGKPLTGALKSMVEWILRNKKAVGIFAAVIGGVLLVAIAAYTVAMIQAAVATVAATWPILAIVAAAAALVVGVLWLWKNWDKVWNWIKDHKALAALLLVFAPFIATIVAIVGAVKFLAKHWDTIWGAISAAAKWAWDNVIKPVWDAMSWTLEHILVPTFNFLSDVVKDTFDIITSVVTWAWDNVIRPVWDAIWWTVEKILVPTFKVLWGIVKVAFGIIADVIGWAWRNVIKPVWDAILWTIDNVLVPAFNVIRTVVETAWRIISTVIETAWGIIKPIFDAIWWVIGNILAPYFNFLWGVVKVVFEGVQAVIMDVWDVVRPIWDAIWWAIENLLVPYFQMLWDVVKTVWDAISAAIGWAWDNVIKPVWDKIWGFLDGPLSTAFNAFKLVVETAWNAISSVVSTVWGVLEGIFSTLYGWVHDTLTAMWDPLKNAAKAAWDGIGNAIKSALSFIGDKIGGFLGIVGDIAEAVGLNNIADFLHRGADAAKSWGKAMGGIVGTARKMGGLVGMASGGVFGLPATAVGKHPGFMTDGPVTIVGEGNPAYPEWVIPSDPRYRTNAVKLYQQAGASLFAGGGVLGREADGGPLEWASGLISKAWDAFSGAAGWIKNEFGDIINLVRGILANAVEKAWPGPLDVPGGFAGLPPSIMNKAREGIITAIRGKATEIDEEQKRFAAISFSGGGAGRLTANTAAARAFGAAMWGGRGLTGIGGYADRNVAGTNRKSLHAFGRALDWMIGGDIRYGRGNEALGDQIAAFFRGPGRAMFDVRNVLWKVMTGGNHFNHVHTAFNRAMGGLVGSNASMRALSAQVLDSGGWIPPGLSLVLNRTGQPERVPPPGEGRPSITVMPGAVVIQTTGEVTEEDGRRAARALMAELVAGVD